MGNGWTLAATSLRVNWMGSWKGRMPSTVPWRFWGDGTLVLGFGAAAGGCWAWNAPAATGAAASHAANVRRLGEGFWFMAIPRQLGAGIASDRKSTRLNSSHL